MIISTNIGGIMVLSPTIESDITSNKMNHWTTLIYIGSKKKLQELQKIKGYHTYYIDINTYLTV